MFGTRWKNNSFLKSKYLSMKKSHNRLYSNLRCILNFILTHILFKNLSRNFCHNIFMFYIFGTIHNWRHPKGGRRRIPLKGQGLLLSLFSIQVPSPQKQHLSPFKTMNWTKVLNFEFTIFQSNKISYQMDEGGGLKIEIFGRSLRLIWRDKVREGSQKSWIYVTSFMNM